MSQSQNANPGKCSFYYQFNRITGLFEKKIKPTVKEQMTKQKVKGCGSGALSTKMNFVLIEKFSVANG